MGIAVWSYKRHDKVMALGNQLSHLAVGRNGDVLWHVSPLIVWRSSVSLAKKLLLRLMSLMYACSIIFSYSLLYYRLHPIESCRSYIKDLSVLS